MEDLNILRALLAGIASFQSAHSERPGELARDLEILFDKLSKRSATLERAYYDFWNVAEVISVSCMEEKRPITEKEANDVKQLLEKLENVVKTEMQAHGC
jgi:hypothetical protein